MLRDASRPGKKAGKNSRHANAGPVVQAAGNVYFRATPENKPMINDAITAYNQAQAPADRQICELLGQVMRQQLGNAEEKIWHRHPVWFLNGNPVAGYSKLKGGVRLLFWSGQSFDEAALQNEGSFKAAEARYTDVAQISLPDLKRWLEKAKHIQWDYKNIVKRKGRLERLEIKA